MSLGRFFWGLALVLIGLIFLLVNYNILSPSVFSQIWKLWPLLIVVVGFSVLTKGTSRIVGIIISIVIFLIVLAGAFFAIVPTVQCTNRSCVGTGSSTSTTIISEPIQDGTKSAQVTLEMGAAELRVAGSSNLLAEGEIVSNTVKANVNRSTESGIDKLNISSDFSNGRFWFRSLKNSWDIKLNKEIPLDLVIKNGAVDAEVDLRQTNLQSLSIQGGASSFDITLPDKIGTARAEISAGASSFDIRVPKNTALSINAETGLSSNNFEKIGLEKSGNNYTSENYNSSTKKIDLVIKAGASSISINYY